MAIACVLTLHKKAEPHQRWITLHGDSEGEGQHVLIEGAEGGGAVVVGGAGGALTGKVLHRVKPEHQPPPKPPPVVVEKKPKKPPGKGTRVLQRKPPPTDESARWAKLDRAGLTDLHRLYFLDGQDQRLTPKQRAEKRLLAARLASHIKGRFPDWKPGAVVTPPPGDDKPPAEKTPAKVPDTEAQWDRMKLTPLNDLRAYLVGVTRDEGYHTTDRDTARMQLGNLDRYMPKRFPGWGAPTENWDTMTERELTHVYREHMRSSQSAALTPAERGSQRMQAHLLGEYLQRRFPNWTDPDSPGDVPVPDDLNTLNLEELSRLHGALFARLHHPNVTPAQRATSEANLKRVKAHMQTAYPGSLDPPPTIMDQQPVANLQRDDLIRYHGELQRRLRDTEISVPLKARLEGRLQEVTEHAEQHHPGAFPRTPFTTAHSWSTPATALKQAPENVNWRTTDKDERSFHLRAFSHEKVPEAVLACIQRAPGLSKVFIDIPDAKVSHYTANSNPALAAITMQSPRRPNEHYTRAVWRHEYGHHVDYTLGQGLRDHDHDGRIHCGSHFDAPALKKDADALVHTTTEAKRLVPEKRATAAIEARLNTEFDEARAQDRPRTFICMDLFKKAGFDPKEMDEALGEQAYNKTTVITLLAAIEAKDVDALMNTVRPEDTGTQACLEDFWGAITNRRLVYSSGHTQEYYNEGYKTRADTLTSSNTTEAYANWFCIQSAPVRFWAQVMEQLAPETHAAFQTRTDRWLRGEPGVDGVTSRGGRG